jgi:hypothetical protein
LNQKKCNIQTYLESLNNLKKSNSKLAHFNKIVIPNNKLIDFEQKIDDIDFKNHNKK